MTAGGLAGASAESAKAAAARRRRNAVWYLAFDSAASRLAWQHPHDRQHAAAGILLGASRVTLAVRRTEGGRREAHLLAARVVSSPALPLRSGPSSRWRHVGMQARSDGISATTVVRTRVDLGATVARPGGASLRSARHLPFGFELPCGEPKVGGGRRTCWRPVWCPRQHCPDEAVQAADGEMSECKRVRTEFPRLR